MTKPINTQDVFSRETTILPCMVDAKGVGRLYVLAYGYDYSVF